MLTVFPPSPAADFPGLLGGDPNEFQNDQRRREAGLFLVLLHQTEHFVLPDLHAVLTHLLEHVTAGQIRWLIVVFDVKMKVSFI